MHSAMNSTPRFAGFWRRFAAYCIDSIPITILVTVTYGQMIGLQPTMQQYLRNRSDPVARSAYVQKRNECRNIAALVLVAYGTLLEGSTARGTIGKRILGLRVQSADGAPLGFGMAFVRNASKLLSLLPLAIGFVWAAFDRRKQAWHDKFAGSVVLIGSLPRMQRSQPPQPPQPPKPSPAETEDANPYANPKRW